MEENIFCVRVPRQFETIALNVSINENPIIGTVFICCHLNWKFETPKIQVNATVKTWKYS